MNYINGVSIFDICQAYQQLESDYNVGGWVRERPSNQRRNESIGCQLARIGYSDVYRWVNIVPAEDDDLDDSDDDAVRDIYLTKVLEWGLPIDDEMRDFIAERYVAEWLEKFPTWSKQ